MIRLVPTYHLIGSEWVRKGRPSLPAGAATYLDPSTLVLGADNRSKVGAGRIAAYPTTVFNTTTANVVTTAANGDVTILGDGYVLENRVITGRIIVGSSTVHPTDVQIRNCEVRGKNVAYAQNANLIDTSNGVSTLIEFCTIYHINNGAGVNGIGTKNFTEQFNDIHHVIDPIRINDTGAAANATAFATCRGSWYHDLLLLTPDPLNTRKDDKTHSDGIQIESNPTDTQILLEGLWIEAYHSIDGTSNVVNCDTIVIADGSSQIMPVDPPNGRPHPQSTSAIQFSPSANKTINNVTLRKSRVNGGTIGVNGTDKVGGYLVLDDVQFDHGTWLNAPLNPKTAANMTKTAVIYYDTKVAV